MAKIDRTYSILLHNILKDGYRYEDPNRKGVFRRQISHHIIEHDFKNGFPAISTKKLAWKSVVGELLWILRGDTDIKYLLDNNIPIWNKDAYNYYVRRCEVDNWRPLSFKDWLDEVKRVPNEFESGVKDRNCDGKVGRGYGAQLRGFMGGMFVVDQLFDLIHTLKRNPMATKKTVTFWNPAESPSTALTPCHWSFEILVEPIGPLDMAKNSDKTKVPYEYDGPKYQFTLKWNQHSVDTFLGLPFNIASYALLAKIIGKLTNMKPKGIIGNLSNVHIYEPHVGAALEQMMRPFNKYGNCELEEFTGWKMGMHGNIDAWLNSKEISDFKLKNYESFPRIEAKMLAYSK